MKPPWRKKNIHCKASHKRLFLSVWTCNHTQIEYHSELPRRFNGPETNCGIAHILGILLMNSYNTDIFFSNYYNLQSVHFELQWYIQDYQKHEKYSWYTHNTGNKNKSNAQSLNQVTVKEKFKWHVTKHLFHSGDHMYTPLYISI